MLEFHDDAIVLSGVTGTKLKCQILGEYYPFWWKITSGGERRSYRLQTSIVELNAGTGEDYIEDTDETVLGSSGHALKLKLENEEAYQLRVVLVEENSECFSHLLRMVSRRWPKSSSGVGLEMMNSRLPDAIATLENQNLGRSIFFFDPLLYTSYSDVEAVARSRIKTYYHTGTEFIVFVFTSDFFQGRESMDVAPLPSNIAPGEWSAAETLTVKKVDDLMGSTEWRSSVLTASIPETRIGCFVAEYRKRLHRWFRYVLPLPFAPKSGQIYHIFLCSNFEVGVRATKGFYSRYTDNPRYSPDNRLAYSRFSELHPEQLDYAIVGKPPAWKILWKVVTDHEEGICDFESSDFTDIPPGSRNASLKWLCEKGYLKEVTEFKSAWETGLVLYQLDWEVAAQRLGIFPPKPLEPLSPDSIGKARNVPDEPTIEATEVKKGPMDAFF
jgi:three-Cys-motif partner protein